MKRSLLGNCINWWHDGDKPSWLRTAIKSDPELGDLESSFDSLSDRLRADAAAWAEEAGAQVASRPEVSHAVVEKAPATSKEGRGVPYVMATAIAAAITLMVTWQLYGNMRTSGELLAEPKLASVQGVGNEIEALVSVGDVTMRSLQDSLAGLPELLGSKEVTISNVKTLRTATLENFEFASRSYGQALAFIEGNVRSQLIRD